MERRLVRSRRGAGRWGRWAARGESGSWSAACAAGRPAAAAAAGGCGRAARRNLGGGGGSRQRAALAECGGAGGEPGAAAEAGRRRRGPLPLEEPAEMLAENLVEEFEMKEDEPWYDHQDLQQGEGAIARRGLVGAAAGSRLLLPAAKLLKSCFCSGPTDARGGVGLALTWRWDCRACPSHPGGLRFAGPRLLRGNQRQHH